MNDEQAYRQKEAEAQRAKEKEMHDMEVKAQMDNEEFIGGTGRRNPHYQPPETPMTSSSCFPAGTKILTPQGNVDIAQISNGQSVLSFCPVSGNVCHAEVLQIKADTSWIWHIELSNDQIIRTTKYHSFQCDSGWKKVSEMRSGDILSVRSSDGKMVKAGVKKCGATATKEPVYNLIVDQHFTYIADGMMVSSFTYCRSLRILKWKLCAFLINTFKRKYKPAITNH